MKTLYSLIFLPTFLKKTARIFLSLKRFIGGILYISPPCLIFPEKEKRNGKNKTKKIKIKTRRID